MTNTESQRLYRKSTKSGGSGGNCVEWSHTDSGVYIRDSKDPHGPEITVTTIEWDELLVAAQGNVAHRWITHNGGSTHLTKDGRSLRFTPAEWTAFVQAITAGECARLALAL